MDKDKIARKLAKEILGADERKQYVDVIKKRSGILADVEKALTKNHREFEKAAVRFHDLPGISPFLDAGGRYEGHVRLLHDSQVKLVDAIAHENDLIANVMRYMPKEKT